VLRRCRIEVLLIAVVSTALVAAGEVSTGRVSIQLVNPDLAARVRVVLDERDLTPPARNAPPERPTESWPPPEQLGSIDLERGSQHRLFVEVAGVDARAQLVFRVEKTSQWIVLHYHPRSGDLPPTVTFSLQDGPYLVK
jgi:hypothetical protein